MLFKYKTFSMITHVDVRRDVDHINSPLHAA